jgi:hypothetical protein
LAGEELGGKKLAGAKLTLLNCCLIISKVLNWLIFAIDFEIFETDLLSVNAEIMCKIEFAVPVLAGMYFRLVFIFYDDFIFFLFLCLISSSFKISS